VVRHFVWTSELIDPSLWMLGMKKGSRSGNLQKYLLLSFENNDDYIVLSVPLSTHFLDYSKTGSF